MLCRGGEIVRRTCKWTRHTTIVGEYEKRASEQQRKLDQLFWLQQRGRYAFAIGNNGKPVDQPTVLSLVPEWWRLLPLERVQRMTVQLADESHASDWGMRIISSRSPLYNLPATISGRLAALHRMGLSG